MKIIIGTRGEIGTVYEEMLRLRRKIFGGRLQWDIPSTHKDPEMEEDAFDTDETVYIVLGDPAVACCRLIPTTGRTMISVLWPDVMNGIEPRPTVWELSRFAVDKDAHQPVLLSATLLLEAYKFALAREIEHYIVVSTHAAAKVIHRMGINTSRLPSLDPTIHPWG